VETFFCASAPFQGYAGFLHGGIIASLLDGAMTNCLFCQGKVAMTAELSVRYLKPIPLGQILTIRSWIEKSRSRLYILKAEITSHENLWAQGIGKFMEKPRIENTREPTRPANPICFQILLPP
jgi:uncharacterized protein (TIGR00369 family)